MTDTFHDETFEFTDKELEIYVEFLDLDELDQEGIEEEILQEAPLSLMQRMRRSRAMKRRAPRLKQQKKLKAKRMAPLERLNVRARKAARNLVRKRSAGKMGENYKNLSPSQKISVDKIIEKKGGQIDKIAKRLLPKIRKKELERLKKARSSVKTESHNPYDVLWEAYANVDLTGLEKKADRFDLDIEELETQLYEGMNDWLLTETSLTPQQYGYARVNKYICEEKNRIDKFKKIMTKKSDQELIGHMSSGNKVHKTLAQNELRRRKVEEGVALKSTEDKQKREREQLKDRQTRERAQARARDMRASIHREETVHEASAFSKAAKNSRQNAAAKKDARDRMMKPVSDKEKMFPKKTENKESYEPVEWGTPESVERYASETPGQNDVSEAPSKSNKMVKDLMTAKYMKKRLVPNKKKYDRSKDKPKKTEY